MVSSNYPNGLQLQLELFQPSRLSYFPRIQSILTPTAAAAQPEARSYEFIDVEDKDGPRRAKSHAVKDSRRRQKAAESSRFQKSKGENRHKTIAAGPIQADHPQMQSVTPPILHLGCGQVDPFELLPVKLNRKDIGLVHYYHTQFLPMSFEIGKTDYSPIRELALSVMVQDPPSFYILVAGVAESIALRTKAVVSHRAILYRGRAMKLINDRMKKPEEALGDGAISACSVLAGFELLFGTPATYEIHMDGLCQMIELRGGLREIEKSNPKLAALVAWHDFAGAANLAGRRRFEFTSHDSPLARPHQYPRFVPPLSCPGAIPRNYTLYDDLLIVLDGIENATLLQHAPTPQRWAAYEEFVDFLNKDLIRTIIPYPNHTTPSRRYLIEDSYRLAALIYVSALCEGEREEADWDGACEALVSDLFPAMLDPTSDWGHVVKMILRLLMKGGRARSCECVNYVMQLLDYSLPMDWYAWKRVRDGLFDFLMMAEVCKGAHQEFWVCTMDLI